MVGELSHIKQIVGDAPHDGAHLGVVVVGVIQLQQVVKGILAHIGFNMHAHDMADAGHKILRRSVNDTEHEVERCQLEHDLGCQRDAHTHGGVGNGAHDLGQDDIAHGGQGCTEQVDEQHLFVLGQIGQKAPDESPAAGMVCTGSRMVVLGIIPLLFRFLFVQPLSRAYARQPLPFRHFRATSPGRGRLS